jgi:hypothetical protein
MVPNISIRTKFRATGIKGITVMSIRHTTRWTTAGFAALIAVLIAVLTGCGKAASPPAATDPAATEAAATEPAERATSPDLADLPSPDSAPPAEWAGKELPVRMIPNIPQSAEAYYAPDNLDMPPGNWS